jgi:branched-chain amino acid transport system substrate-binding protein
MTPRIGISNAAADFDIIYEAPLPIRPDPYLVEQESLPHTMAPRPPALRVVR